MLVTEKTALTLGCPVALAGNQGNGMLCGGSGCMAWREVETKDGKRGFCGMAGTPPDVQGALIRAPMEFAAMMVGGDVPKQ